MSRLLQRTLGALAVISVAISAASAQSPQPETALFNRDAAVYSEASGDLYLVDFLHDAVSVLSSSGNSSSIQVGSKPIAVVLNHRTGMLYVVNSGGRSVSVIDDKTHAVKATVETAARPYAIAVDAAADKVYVSNTFSNKLTVIEGATNTTTNLPVGSADIIVVNPDPHRIILFGYESDTVTELDPATGATVKLPAGALHLWGAARVGKTLYVSHVQEHSIGAIDLTTHTVSALPTGAMPCAIAVSSSTGKIYVANYADGTVTVLDHGKPSSLKVTSHPQGLTLDDAAGLLYIASPQQNAITVVDTKTLHVKGTLSDPDHPYAVALNPVTHKAYGVNLGAAPFTAIHLP
jgi:YVTN family beta-propeller protein